MKDNTLDILMYLFDNYLDDGLISTEQEISLDELELAGFLPDDIRRAFSWLQSLADEMPTIEHIQDESALAFRVFTPEECQALSMPCRDFLYYIEKSGIIDAKTRELIIEYVMVLGAHELELIYFKRIVLMVLLNQPEQETAALWIEESIKDDADEIPH